MNHYEGKMKEMGQQKAEWEKQQKIQQMKTKATNMTKSKSYKKRKVRS